jgi:hypothetical protein
MTLHLPKPIEIYFSSENAHDTSAVEQCFAADAVVRDERKTIRGLDAIRAWRTETGEKYNHTVEPLAISTRDGKTIVKSKVAGTFPGSPIDLDYIFELDADRIISLEIR